MNGADPWSSHKQACLQCKHHRDGPSRRHQLQPPILLSSPRQRLRIKAAGVIVECIAMSAMRPSRRHASDGGWCQAALAI